MTLRHYLAILVLLLLLYIPGISATGTADLRPPQLLRMELNPKAGSTGATVGEVTLLLADDSSGIDLQEPPSVSFKCPDGHALVNVTTAPLAAQPPAGGGWAFRGTLDLSGWAPGTWWIEEVRARDDAGNLLSLSREQLSFLGYPIEMAIASPAGEVESPQASSGETVRYSENLNVVGGISASSQFGNSQTGSSFKEDYSQARELRRQRNIYMEDSGSYIESEATFSGQASVGLVKAAGDRPRDGTTYASSEDYTGDFHLKQKMDDYGENVETTSGAEGQGSVYVERSLGTEITSRHSGTGSYEGAEKASTLTGYLAKDINASWYPTSFRFSPDLNVTYRSLWMERMSGKSPAKDAHGSDDSVLDPDFVGTLIGEEFLYAHVLHKEAVFRGPQDLTSQSNFSGIRDLRALRQDKGNDLDVDERYMGQYNTSSSVNLYEVHDTRSPALAVWKDGALVSASYNGEARLFARYVITLRNRGSETLEPLLVQDVFPPGSSFVNASARPSQQTQGTANWTLTHLSPGDDLKIEVMLLLEEGSTAWINQVYAAGGLSQGWITASNFSLLQEGWLDCCPPYTYLRREALVDPDNPRVAVITLTVENPMQFPVSMRLTDLILGDMVPISFRPQPADYLPGRVTWNFPALEPGESLTVEYRAAAMRNGVYPSRSYLEVATPYGMGMTEAYAQVEITGAPEAPYTTRYGGWQLPQWDMDASQEGLWL